jgi:multicomponent Na+:H+ antiporter subunit G
MIASNVASNIAIMFGILGTGLIVVAGIGIIRMPDLPTRMHASSKAGTLGAILLLVGVAIAYQDTAVVMRVVLIVLFLLLTAPVAAHMIARAGYRSGVPLTPETVIDEYREVCGTAEEER